MIPLLLARSAWCSRPRLPGCRRAQRRAGEALLLSRSGRYELILLDEDMTDASVIETCEQIRSFSEVPLFVMGAEKAVEAMQAGADGYLRKPFGVSEMFAALGANVGGQAVARS